MPKILELFDSSRALTRPIEKVITYQNRTEEQLRAEISEYVVTEHIEESFKELLGKMQIAQQGEGGHEIGVWVSGFYGSGKSSFTKYLGFSLDRTMTLGGDPFIKLLQNQIHSSPVRAMFNQVSTVYDAAVIFLDLASEMLAGASMEDISTVLYLKVLQWAGYSEDLKVAELERMLEGDGKLEAFKARAQEELGGIDWVEVHNQPLVANQIAAQLATEFYPNIFKSASGFGDLTLHVSKAENKRAEEMIALIRRKSGKKNVLFIIDEVGQYVSAKPSLILNLDGLAKNLKQIGGGAVWIFGTAQQTLTDDNPTAALNSPGLYKLKDRFPIQIHLEASDIKEICHKRLLTKSASGEQALNQLFDQYGSSLRTATQLYDAGGYEAELTRKLFVDLYPFLPAHFEILLQLLGRLAKKTGGLGLRSAIKVVQEVLVERGMGQHPLADAEIGRLANTVTFYDSLRRDIFSSFPHVVEGVQRVEQRLPKDSLAQDVAKSIAILQILDNLPVTVSNIAALMQPEVASASVKDQVEKAVDAMLKDAMIPLGEKDGGLRFLTQAAVTLQRQFEEIEYRQADVRAELNGVLRSIFHPLPSARVAQVRPVTAGLRVVLGGGQSVALEGEREPIQIHVEFAPTSSYETTRTERENDSRSSREKSNIYLLGRAEPEADQLALTLVRCRKFLDAHRTTSDPETQEYVRIVEARLNRSSAELERKLAEALLQGSFVAQGSHEAVSGRGTHILEASKAFLGDAAAKVFDRYEEAAFQADSSLAEKFLTTSLDRITSSEDPLSLVSRAGGKSQVKLDHKAIISISDYLGQSGQVEGRRLLDHFSAPPFGWSKDTTRYLLAAAFLGGSIKLRIAGHDHQVRNDESLEAFRSNKALSSVGVGLREERPDPDALLRASDRLRDLTGETIMPLEDEIAASARKCFPTFQASLATLPTDLRTFGLPQEAADRAETLTRDIAQILSGDGSDVVHRFGGVESPFFEDLQWARKLKKALSEGLRKTLSHLQQLRRDVRDLPDTGIPSKLRSDANEILAKVDEILQRDSFFEEASALSQHSDALDSLFDKAVQELSSQQAALRQQTLDSWGKMDSLKILKEEDREWATREVSKLDRQVQKGPDGFKQLLSLDYTQNHQLREVQSRLEEKAEEYRAQKPDPGPEGGVQQVTLLLPAQIQTKVEVQNLLRQLQQYLQSMEAGTSLQIKCQFIKDK